MTMASASTVGRRSPARSWTLRSQRTHSGAGGRRDVLCSPTWIWGCWTRKAHGAVQDLGHCCSPGLLFPLPGCLWVQEGSALSFASRKGGGELAQVPLSAAKGDRAPWWLWPFFHPHMELSSCISETRVCNQRCCDYPASISGGLKGGGFLHEKKKFFPLNPQCCQELLSCLYRNCPSCTPSLLGMCFTRNSDWPPWAYRKHPAKKGKQIMWTELNFPQGVIFLRLLLLNARASWQKDREEV